MPFDGQKISRRRFIGTAAATLIAAPSISRRAAAATDARAVAQAMNTAELTRGFVGKSSVRLYRGGSARERTLDIAVVQQGSSDQSLRRYGFTAPSDIAGTRLLVRENPRADNDTWLFLPAAGRTRRITTSNQSGAFAGTDFSYADMMTMRLEKYDHRILASDRSSITLESVVNDPRHAKSIGYSRIVSVMSARSYVPFRVEYFDLKGRRLKTQEMTGAKRTPEGRSVLTRRVMTTADGRNRTEIIISDLSFKAPLRASDFDPQRLSN